MARSVDARPMVPAMRAVLTGGAAFVFLAGVQLFALAESTDRFFAWTIGSPLTAGFLGTFYWAACVIATASALAPSWDRARVGVPGVTVFVVLTLAATLLHLEQFHLDRTGTPRLAAWLWLGVYALQPVALAVAWWQQLRVAGQDPPPERPMPRWLAAAAGVQGAGFLAWGVWLFVAPESVPWPWALTPLTGRAVSAWLVGLGLVALTAAREADLERSRPAMLGYAALAVLQLPLVLRFGEEIGEASAGAAFAAVAIVALATGVTGLVLRRRAPA